MTAPRPASGAKPAPKPEKAARRPADLDLRPERGDESLGPDVLGAIDVFADAKPEELAKRPGAVALRRFQKGEVVCEQGEPGWTAYYIPTAEDMLALRRAQKAKLEPGDTRYDDDIRRIEGQIADREFAAAALERLKLRTPRLDLGGRDAVVDLATRSAKSDPDLATELRVAARWWDLRRWAKVTIDIRPRVRSTTPVGGGLLAGLAAWLVGWKPKPAPTMRRTISADLSTDIPSDTLTDVMYEGEVFGEMSCMHRTPRSATVVAVEGGYLIEMLRSIHDLLAPAADPSKPDSKKPKTRFQTKVNEVYRERVLTKHLLATELFQDAPEKVIELVRDVRDGVKFKTVAAGSPVVKQGDPSDVMYVIRVGTVQVYRETDGIRRVLAYRSRGDTIGEMGLLSGKPRGATCIAYDHPGDSVGQPGAVELIVFDRPLLDAIIAEWPAFHARLQCIVVKRIETEPDASALDLSGPLEELGLPQGQKLMLIDEDRCTRCGDCVRACAQTHPEDGLSRLFLEGPRLGRFLVPTTCRQCRDPVCLIGCPVGAIHKAPSGEIMIEDHCIGCERCVKQCPYGSIAMHPREPETEAAGSLAAERKEEQIAVVCDQCNSLPSGPGEPSCVYACPHGAAMRVDGPLFLRAHAGGIGLTAPASR